MSDSCLIVIFYFFLTNSKTHLLGMNFLSLKIQFDCSKFLVKILGGFNLY